MRNIPLLLIAMLVLGGCAGFPFDFFASKNTAIWTDLDLAHAALQEGNPDEAEAYLIRTLDVAEGKERTAAMLLLAEAKLQKNQPDRAQSLAQEVLATDAKSSAAHEILGKAALKQGDYGRAEAAFVTALATPKLAKPDRRRLEDLTSVARGLSAYAQADPAGARAQWERIHHDKLRTTVTATVRQKAGSAPALAKKSDPLPWRPNR